MHILVVLIYYYCFRIAENWHLIYYEIRRWKMFKLFKSNGLEPCCALMLREDMSVVVITVVPL